MRQSVTGILLLDKPISLTSNQALQKVKRLFNAKKAGHTGSLDPIATGLLPICFGEATKFSQFLLDATKSYRVIAKLGIQTTTGDSEGDCIAIRPYDSVTIERLERVLKNFIGEIEQIPPMFSAIKHHGRPLYELARKGKVIERKPRTIQIFQIKMESFNKDEFSFYVHCSKGTYIRTLVEDIGNQLGCGAHVIALRRLQVASFQNVKMYPFEELESIYHEKGNEGLVNCLLPIESACALFPKVTLSSTAAFYLRRGQPVRANFSFENVMVRLIAEDETFLGIGLVMADGRVKPHRMLSTGYSEK